jgi:CRISPR type I-E-associated protein CasB/Cse2
MRDRYDGRAERGNLSRGDIATLKRCAVPADARMEGVFWALARPVIDGRCRFIDDEAARERAEHTVAEALSVVLCAYGRAPSAAQSKSFGRWLYEGLSEKRVPAAGAAMRFRQLVAARTADELAHRLRTMITFVGAPLDWATLTEDVIAWASSERQRDATLRKWAQDFYTTGERDDGDERSDERRDENQTKEAV